MTEMTTKTKQDADNGNAQPFPQRMPRRIWSVPVLFMVLAGALLTPFPMSGRGWNACFDLAHAPSFFLAAITLAVLLDPHFILGIPSRPLIALSLTRFLALSIMITALGAVLEVGQAFVGRSMSVGDAISNTAGVSSAALLVFAAKVFRGGRRVLAILLAIALIVMPSVSPVLELREVAAAKKEFPLIASFERPREVLGWDSITAELTQSDEWASNGSHSLRICRKGNHRIANAVMMWPPEDWGNYEFFELQVRNAGPEDIRMHLHVGDLQHILTGHEPSDRFHREFVLPANTVTPISVSIADVENSPTTRKLNMQTVSFVNVVFEKKNDLIVFLDELKLTTSKEK